MPDEPRKAAKTSRANPPIEKRIGIPSTNPQIGHRATTPVLQPANPPAGAPASPSTNPPIEERIGIPRTNPQIAHRATTPMLQPANPPTGCARIPNRTNAPDGERSIRRALSFARDRPNHL